MVESTVIWVPPRIAAAVPLAVFWKPPQMEDDVALAEWRAAKRVHVKQRGERREELTVVDEGVEMLEAGAETLVANKDKILSHEAVGFMDVKAQTAMRPDAVFWIASQSKPITREVFASPVPTCTVGETLAPSTNFTDLWWRSPANSESGWGINLTQQGDAGAEVVTVAFALQVVEQE